MTENKIRENRARRASRRQGLRLVKSRRRDPRALEFEKYALVNRETGVVVHGEVESANGLTLDSVEQVLGISE